jgi:RHS repeat-associated protein
VVFDYDNGHYREQQPDANGRIFAEATIGQPLSSSWPVRQDPFSTYRASFEVRTYRLCTRVLMFHHFPDELQTADYLVRSTEFTYNQSAIASFISQVTQSGYVRQADGSYLKKSFPPLSFQYSKAEINNEIETIDDESLKNLPVGVNGLEYQWLDLDGEGLQGVLAEQENGWYYKRNVSPISIYNESGKEEVVARFEPLIEVTTQPSGVEVGTARHQFLDLAGDGSLDVVQLERPVSGFFERTADERWENFIPFESSPNVRWNDPNLRFVDLTGDGHADILITDDEALTWYPSLAEDGFGTAVRVPTSRDEEKAPAVVFADATQTIFTADLSGDGLMDIVRIRNGDVCYWPNLGYGHFGGKVTMDNAPWFDTPDQFDPKHIRLADIDGSGTTDIIYLQSDQVAVYRNQCGNAWSPGEYLTSFPSRDDLSSVVAVDLLGNGTACLVWSSPLPGNGQRQMRYVALMEEKPHLLVGIKNNLGAETVVRYAPSTKFYLQDKYDDKPWITRLPFPVHSVERVETHDLISHNRFISRYAYHHGYFDGEEREFRGFGMVEQWDTEELGTLKAGGMMPDASNVDDSSYVPPTYIKTWFHTGAYIEGGRISRHFEDEYYREGDESDDVSGLASQQFGAMLLPDTELPATLKRQDGSSTPWALTADEVREACRALKGTVLRREIYARDGTDDEDRPYSATEQSYRIELFQPQGGDRHAVFLVHPRESIDFHYERKLVETSGRRIADPRVTHAMTLEVDGYGNVLKSVAIGYGRRPGLSPLQGEDRKKQEQILVTYTENKVTNAVEGSDVYRAPLPCEVCTYELMELPKLAPASNQSEITNLFRFDEILSKIRSASDGQHDLTYENSSAVGALPNQVYRRPIEQVRTFFRSDNLTGLLPLGGLQSLALPGESYELAFTPGLLTQVLQRNGQALLPPTPAAVLGGQGADQGGYMDLESSNHWWVPSGQVFYAVDANIMTPSLTAPSELAAARAHFFLPRKFADPFKQSATVDYDAPHDLLVIKTEDALQNAVQAANNYRTLQPRLITDPNGNRGEVAFDALGMVVATAVMGKMTQNFGDLLEDFEADLALKGLKDFVADPAPQAASLLGKTTARIVYDLDRFMRCGQPPFASSLARETHFFDQGGEQTRIQISFSYSDGFGREIQTKIQAEGGDAPKREAPVQLPSGDISPGALVRGAQGNLVEANAAHRWVGTGRTVFNNKGKPVKQYEPFFSSTHLYEEEREMTDAGVSPILFYDPLDRGVATLHPNHTWEKVVFNPWQQMAYDVNDTILNLDDSTDPKMDKDVKQFFSRLPDTDYLPTWYERRIALPANDPERVAADKAAVHRQTPTVAYLDTLGRTFLTIAHNRFERNSTIVEENYPTRVQLDIEGNRRAVRDAIVQAGDQLGRIAMCYDYDMLGNIIHQASMEAGERWMLNDVKSKLIRAWDSRGFTRRITYDELRRPRGLFVTENAVERLAERTVYGENQGAAVNHRTRVFQIFDGAGVVTSEGYDFKGNVLQSKRELLSDYQSAVDWQQNPAPNNGTFTTRTTYDALNRTMSITTPDDSTYRPSFNKASLLEKVDVDLYGVPTPFVANIDYNAKGQRELIEYDNGMSTSYEYDPDTFRLTNLKTTRPSNLSNLTTQIFRSPGTVQDLRYTYDPMGNLTRITDAALRTTFFGGQQVDPISEYSYDAIYRIIEAKGREHIGQAAHDFNPNNRRDYDLKGLADFIAHPNDLHAMRRYTERYEYDAVGNFEFVRHVANGGSWTRHYEYSADSLLEAAKQSNRVIKSTVGNGFIRTETYGYEDALGNDAHGCMTAINSMQIEWDFKDQLHKANLGGGGTAYYIYDASGQRVRKVVETQTGAPSHERIYIGDFEIYREYGEGVNTVILKRETLHIMDDRKRIALVETETIDSGHPVDTPNPVQRYQIVDHLGSGSLELDDDAQIISYEEYYPYGSTSYQAGRSAAEISLKRYRYTAAERDEETGLSYHHARYYAPWTGRWTSCEPRGIDSDLNLYAYVRGNPVTFVDLDGLQGTKADTILNELVTWAQSLGARYTGRSGASVKLHDVLRTELPNSVAQSPRLVTEAIIDKQGFIRDSGRGPHFAKSLPGGKVKGTYETIDALVIEDWVSDRDVMKIRAGKMSARGKVVPADLKLGGAYMSEAKAASLTKRLGARPVLIGQHGQYFTSRSTLERGAAGLGLMIGIAATGSVLLGPGSAKEKATVLAVGIGTAKGAEYIAARAVGPRLAGLMGFVVATAVTMPNDQGEDYNLREARAAAQNALLEELNGRAAEIFIREAGKGYVPEWDFVYEMAVDEKYVELGLDKKEARNERWHASCSRYGSAQFDIGNPAPVHTPIYNGPRWNPR